MQRVGYIQKRGERYAITTSGRRLLSEEKIWELKIPRQKKWDSRWRMVLYDIPVRKEKQRHAFRAKLRDLGLVLYQNSVWVYPYPLEEIIKEIADFYGIAECVLFAVAEKLNGEQRLKDEFGL